MRPRGSKFVTRGGAGRPIPWYHTRRARVAAPARQPWMWGELKWHARQPIRATSRNRLSSHTLEEMEARLMSRAAIMLIARATVLPRVCAGEARRNTSSVACARAVVLHVYLYDRRWLEHHLHTTGRSLVARTNGGLSDHVTKPSWS